MNNGITTKFVREVNSNSLIPPILKFSDFYLQPVRKDVRR